MKDYSKKAKLDYFKSCKSVLKDSRSKEHTAEITADEIMEEIKNGYKRSY